MRASPRQIAGSLMALGYAGRGGQQLDAVDGQLGRFRFIPRLEDQQTGVGKLLDGQEDDLDFGQCTQGNAEEEILSGGVEQAHTDLARLDLEFDAQQELALDVAGPAETQFGSIDPRLWRVRRSNLGRKTPSRPHPSAMLLPRRCQPAATHRNPESARVER